MLKQSIQWKSKGCVPNCGFGRGGRGRTGAKTTFSKVNVIRRLETGLLSLWQIVTIIKNPKFVLRNLITTWPCNIIVSRNCNKFVIIWDIDNKVFNKFTVVSRNWLRRCHRFTFSAKNWIYKRFDSFTFVRVLLNFCARSGKKLLQN